ncbi:MAG: hypothetical protein DMD95_19175 [Candidatus Rokuibacteriota bacterium]|nr:MAG: hypothetical protein DMD95_19175 [Candidatus Rokubacteria bacterium]
MWADPYRWAVIGAIHRRPFLCSRSSTSSPGARPDGPGHSRNRLCFVVFAPVAGWLYDHWAARTVVPMGGQVLGVVLALTGQVMSLTQYYLCSGVLSAAGFACIGIPSTAIVTRWFVRSRGTAMGVLSTGTPASAAAFYPVNAWLVVTLGWRTVLMAFGSIVATGADPSPGLLPPPTAREGGGQEKPGVRSPFTGSPGNRCSREPCGKPANDSAGCRRR